MNTTKQNQTTDKATARPSIYQERLDLAIQARDLLQSDYRRAINPNNQMSAEAAQRIEASYQAANCAVKSAREYVRHEKRNLGELNMTISKAEHAALNAVAEAAKIYCDGWVTPTKLTEALANLAALRKVGVK